MGCCSAPLPNFGLWSRTTWSWGAFDGRGARPTAWANSFSTDLNPLAPCKCCGCDGIGGAFATSDRWPRAKVEGTGTGWTLHAPCWGKLSPHWGGLFRHVVCCCLPNAFPQKDGGSGYGLPSRPVYRSACPQHPRTPLLLSQPSSHPLLRVVQTWVGAALLARQFLVATIRARPQPQRRVAMQEQPPANAQSTSIGFAACS